MRNRSLSISENLRAVSYQEKTLLYNSLTGKALVCHRDMLEIIEAIRRGTSIETLQITHGHFGLESVLKALSDKDLVVAGSKPEPPEPARVWSEQDIRSGKAVNKLRLNVTSSCNMRCDYCYAGSGQKERMPWAIAQKAIDRFLDLQHRHGHNFCIVRFFGGEPLLNWPVVNAGLDYIKVRQNRLRVGYILNTNGTIFSRQIAEKLKANDVCLAVSLDGGEKEHNAFRKLKSGRNSFRKITGNIEKYLREGCRLGIEATVGDHNIFRLKELVDLLADLSDRHGDRIPLALQHMTVVSKENRDVASVAEKTAQFSELFRYAMQKNIPVNTGLSFFPFNSLMGQRPASVYCRAMAGELCVHPSGDIHPCGALNLRLGTIDDLNGVFRSEAFGRLAERRAGNIPECRGCDIEAFCAGGCVADAFAAKGGINTAASNCDLERAIFKELVRQYVLSPENRTRAYPEPASA